MQFSLQKETSVSDSTFLDEITEIRLFPVYQYHPVPMSISISKKQFESIFHEEVGELKIDTGKLR